LSVSEPIFLLFGQPAEAASAAAIYAETVKWALLPGLWFGVLRAFVGAIGRPKPVIATALVGVAANAVLDYGLIFGHFGLPAWGVYGAAVATVLVNCRMFLTLLTIAITRTPYRRYSIMARFWRADWPKLIETLRVGIPSGISVVLEVGFFIGSVFVMGRIGAFETAAHHIAIQSAAITFMIPLGLSQVGTIRVGHAFGRGDFAGVAMAGWIVYALGCAVMTVAGICFWLFPETITAIYIDPNNPANFETVRLAVSFLAIAALFQIFDAAQVIGIGILRGLSDTRVPMIISAVGYWGIGATVGIGCASPLGYGAIGVWVGLLVGLGVVALAMGYRFHTHVKRLAHVNLQAKS
jgi:MATE family multidrug resistance protein